MVWPDAVGGDISTSVDNGQLTVWSPGRRRACNGISVITVSYCRVRIIIRPLIDLCGGVNTEVHRPLDAADRG